jgi:hypothetical protein
MDSFSYTKGTLTLSGKFTRVNLATVIPYVKMCYFLYFCTKIKQNLMCKTIFLSLFLPVKKMSTLDL